MRKAAVLVMVMIVICGLFSACKTKDDTKVPETSAVSTTAAHEKITSADLYTYFASHSTSTHVLLETQKYTKADVADGTMLLFAVNMLDEGYLNKLQKGEISSSEYDMFTGEHYKEDVDKITHVHFGKTVGSYSSTNVIYSAESGGITLKNPINTVKCRLVAKEIQNVGSSYSGTFTYYQFPADATINEEALSKSDSQYDGNIFGTVDANLRINEDDKNNITVVFDDFQVTKK